MNIFQMSVADVDKYRDDIIELIQQSFTKSFSEMNVAESYFQNRVKTLKEYIRDNKATVYAIENEIGLVGIIWFYIKVDIDERVIHIVHFVVREKCRLGGIGNKLLDKVEEYARKVGINHIVLLVTKSNEGAVKFYKNRDFEVARYVMSRRL